MFDFCLHQCASEVMSSQPGSREEGLWHCPSLCESDKSLLCQHKIWLCRHSTAPPTSGQVTTLPLAARFGLLYPLSDQHESTWRTALKARGVVCPSALPPVSPHSLCVLVGWFISIVHQGLGNQARVMRKESMTLDLIRLQRMPLQNCNSETSEVWQENLQKIKQKLSFGPETDLSIWQCPLACVMLQLPCKIFNYVF